MHKVEQHQPKQRSYNRNHLGTLINNSLSESIIPDLLKITKITPIPKSGESRKVEKFCPLSMLSSISKIFKKVLFKRLYAYLDNNDMLNENHIWLRPKRSTTDAKFDLHQMIENALNRKENSLCLSLFIYQRTFIRLIIIYHFKKWNGTASEGYP